MRLDKYKNVDLYSFSAKSYSYVNPEFRQTKTYNSFTKEKSIVWEQVLSWTLRSTTAMTVSSLRIKTMPDIIFIPSVWYIAQLFNELNKIDF